MKSKNDSKELCEKIKAIFITGPTASGKTAMSLDLAKKLDGEILCCDSMQIYKKMDIGTAKATLEEQGRCPHHLIDIVEPWEEFSVADYCQVAEKCCRELESRGKTPIFVGGTGLYVTSLVEGYDFEETSSDNELCDELNKKLYQQAETLEGMVELYGYLKMVDPEAAAAIHINNKKRVIRAILLFKLTGKTQRERNAQSKTAGSFLDARVYAINYERSKLISRIEKRVDLMLEEGLVDEVRSLLSYCEAAGHSLSRTAAQAIGYRETLAYLNGDYSYEEMREKIIIATRQYAKRQMTWLRKWPWVQWIEPVQ